MSIDFNAINGRLCSMADVLLPQWFPDGKRHGVEFVVGDLSGNKGDSLSINTKSGVWKDFASSEGGSDLISLYAEMKRIGQADAARELSATYMLEDAVSSVPVKLIRRGAGAFSPGPAPLDAEMPTAPYTSRWVYHDADGAPMFIIHRVDAEDRKKRFTQWSWDFRKGKYVPKAWPEPRPLYNLHILHANPAKRVLLVEGEKCADAAISVLGDRSVVTTWPGGGNAWRKADWSSLAGRQVTIWPDADEPGVKAARGIAKTLVAEHGCEVHVIDVTQIAKQKPGWDIADAVYDGWKLKELVDFAKRHGSPVEASKPVQHTLHVDEPEEAVVRVSDRYAEIWAAFGLMTSGSGVPIANSENVRLVLSKTPKSMPRFWHDEYADRLMTDVAGVSRPCKDEDVIALSMWLQREVGIANIKTSTVWEAVSVVSRLSSVDPVAREISSFTWDGTPRIEAFLRDVVGCKDTAYTRAVSRHLWISLIARVFTPGAKVDTMVILEGGQGVGKSRLLRSMALGERFSEVNLSKFDPRECAMAMSGCMITEIGELHAFSAGAIDSIKQFLSTQIDHYRPPYGRLVIDTPRRGVVIGTTNNDEYLHDETGARRFWPIRCSNSIDLEKASAIRDQCYAEALSLWRGGASWWMDAKLDPDVALQEVEEQETRRAADEWEDVVAGHLAGSSETKTSMIAVQALKMDMKDVTLSIQRRIGRVLRVLGWKPILAGSGSTKYRCWVRAEESDAVAEPVEF